MFIIQRDLSIGKIHIHFVLFFFAKEKLVWYQSTQNFERKKEEEKLPEKGLYCLIHSLLKIFSRYNEVK